MKILIIPGLLGHPEEKIFQELGKRLEANGHSIIKLKWPYFPEDLAKYSMTETIAYVKTLRGSQNGDDFVILGFSMGGVVATEIAVSLLPRKLGLIVSPY